MFNRYTEIAITAMSQLARVYHAEGGSLTAAGTSSAAGTLTAAQMSEGHPYSKAFIAKVLTLLSQQGLVRGTSGRRGGFSLARPPETISLLDISRCFQRDDKTSLCPFGRVECRPVDRCPIHDDLTSLFSAQRRFLAKTRLDVFCQAPIPTPDPGQRLP